MSLAWFNGLLIAWSAIALISFGSLWWKPAPYGRYFESGWGRALDARWGWILMETPAVLVLPLWFLISERSANPIALVFVLLWLVQRRLAVPPLARASAGLVEPAAVPDRGGGLRHRVRDQRAFGYGVDPHASEEFALSHPRGWVVPLDQLPQLSW